MTKQSAEDARIYRYPEISFPLNLPLTHSVGSIKLTFNLLIFLN